MKPPKPILASSLLKPHIDHNDETVYEAMKKVRYPVLATIKLDGIRALKSDILYSRTLELIPNRSIQERAFCLPSGLDMELWDYNLSFNDIQSIVMSESHPDSEKIKFFVLDKFDYPNLGYSSRVENIIHLQRCYDIGHCPFIFHKPTLVTNADSLFTFERDTINQYGEGICFRSFNAPYKNGRSTLKEQYLVKLSRFVRTEVEIVGFIEQMKNANGEKRNNVGAMKRESCAVGMVPKNTLGALVVKNNVGIIFFVGTGFDAALGKKIWENRVEYIGRTITIKSKAHNEKYKPRTPVFVGFRDGGE